MWKCVCDCGNIINVGGVDLKRDHTRSCGCLKREMTIKRLTGKKSPMKGKHGKKHNEETKRMISENHVDVNGENNPMYGKCGKNSPNYKHGLSGTREYNNYYNQKRRATKLNQTPKNANLDKIQLYYSICAYLNEPCEKSMWHVDHIQPLSKGGLHHEDNLQILTAAINLQKSNKWPLTAEEEIQYKGVRI